MNKRILALIAAFLATTIYGINHSVAKEVMPIYIGGRFSGVVDRIDLDFCNQIYSTNP